MPVEPTPQILERLAHWLRSEATALTDRWIERLSERLGVRPRRLLSDQALRDHFPVLLAAAADHMVLPVTQLSNEMTDILRRVSLLRREQGYDIQEVLLEFDALADLVFEAAAEWAEGLGEEVGGGEAMRAARSLASVLQQIATVAVGTYREEELRQAQELSAQLGQFAATIGHELANPLNTASLSVELLTEDAVGQNRDQRLKHVEVIRDRLERIHQLVDDIRALAMAEDARSESRWLPVGGVIRAVVEEVGPVAERHGVVIEIEEALDDFPVDAARVEIALINLVTNGIKFSDPEKSERWVRIATGEAKREDLEGGQQIMVSDNGRGISPEAQNKVFDRFYRAVPEVEGSGLGLEIARRAVKQGGGRLWLESELGVGTTFYIEMPEHLASGDHESDDVER